MQRSAIKSHIRTQKLGHADSQRDSSDILRSSYDSSTFRRHKAARQLYDGTVRDELSATGQRVEGGDHE
jgi:hypothetical protein